MMLEFLLFVFGILPATFIHLMVLLGVFGFLISIFATSIPFIKKHGHFLKATSIVIFLIGIYFEGGLAVTKDYERKLQEWRYRIQAAETEAKEASGRIEYVVEEKIQVVKDTQVVIQERIRDISVNVDRECRITQESIDVLNQAAKERK